MIFSIIIKQENKYNLTFAIEVVFQFGTSKCDTSTVCFALDFMAGKEIDQREEHAEFLKNILSTLNTSKKKV